jgi:hypothetical protein
MSRHFLLVTVLYLFMPSCLRHKSLDSIYRFVGLLGLGPNVALSSLFHILLEEAKIDNDIIVAHGVCCCQHYLLGRGLPTLSSWP